MKKYHLILACSLIFIWLFYNETIGVNASVFGLVLTGLICYLSQKRFLDKSNLILILTSVVSCFAFAWYGDFISFVAMGSSLIFLRFSIQDPKLKIVQSIPLVFINLFATSVRIFQFSQWLPQRKVENQLVKKLIAYFAIPALFLTLFFSIYSFGSAHFSGLFSNYTLDLDLEQVLLIGVVGFYFSFSFWNYWVPQYCYDANSKLDDDFSREGRMVQQQTFSFLDLDFERKSGEITLVLLNCMILIFIGTYNYEQFFEEQALVSLSEATHERVNAVIFSILMAVGVMLFYFKSGFNFDKKASKLKLLSKIWIALNGILISSTIIKNVEYVSAFGLTYKRLGVFAFLLLASIGLALTFWKIYKQKTNAYLFNQMIWYFYGTVLLCSFINWGNVITRYNIRVNKGVELHFLESLDFNDVLYWEYSASHTDAITKKTTAVEDPVQLNQKKSVLSKVLYYETLKKE
ncbi:DUF4173 domain-containing protein [Flavobacterium sp. XS2P39]|uniref:DUF4153 domain-containing protein n=1 Tax=Flavobacterium sp. XS2P39 TaxID=3401725 RepID=UPI003AAE74A6